MDFNDKKSLDTEKSNALGKTLPFEEGITSNSEISKDKKIFLVKAEEVTNRFYQIDRQKKDVVELTPKELKLLKNLIKNPISVIFGHPEYYSKEFRENLLKKLEGLK
jgi:DNA-binding response OmpR family regulator